MREVTKIFLFLAATCCFHASAQARPVRLVCSDSVDLYADPYNVVVDSDAMTVQIVKSEGLFAGKHAYRITAVGAASGGGYYVSAAGRDLNSKINVMVSPDEKWVGYTDALTNQAYATDYCN